jgi:hypothetical protein
MAFQDRMTLRNLYLYLICLITLMISIFAAVSLVRNTVALLYPDPGYGHMPTEAGVSAEEQQRRERLLLDSQRRQEVLGLVGSATTLLITVPVYAYHWRRIQTELPSHPTRETGARQPPGPDP